MHPYSDPDRPALRVEALRPALVVDGGFWTRLELVEETGSTNSDVLAAARAGEPEGLVVVAEHQDAGRGRLDRTWYSPPRAGLAVSVLLRPGAQSRDWQAVPPKRRGWLPLLAGVALCESVTRLTGVDATMKWPNDLLVEERKCAGVLAEAWEDVAVVGIGLNVSMREHELPPDPPWATPATSLVLAGATMTDRAALLRALLVELESWYRRWRAVGGDADACGLRTAYLRSCATIGRRVRALLPSGGERCGTAVTVDGDGRLVLRQADGDTWSIASGDILHVRRLFDSLS